MTILASKQLDFKDEHGDSIAPLAPSGISAMQVFTQAVSAGAHAEQLEAVLKLVDHEREFQARQAYTRAMAACQSSIPTIAPDALNTQTQSMYVKRETVEAVIRPIYLRHGFTVSVDEAPPVDGNVCVRMIVQHVDGHAQTFSRFAPPDTAGIKGTKNKTDVQGSQSTMSYLTRRLYCDVFGITVVGEDKDGSGKPAGLIGEKEIATITQMLKDSNSDMQGFRNFIGVDTLAEMTHDDFRKGVAAIQSKKRGGK